jgi:hypothetical protein
MDLYGLERDNFHPEVDLLVKPAQTFIEYTIEINTDNLLNDTREITNTIFY